MLKFIKRKYKNLVSDKKFSEILTGSAWALSARVLATGLGLVTSIIVVRFYGAEVMGILAVINSFLMLATIFTVLGTKTSILRLIPEHLIKFSPTSAFKIFRKIQYLVIGASLIAGTLLFFGAELIAGKVFSKPQLSFYFAMAAVFIIFKSLMLLNTQALRGLKLIRVFAFMLVLPRAFNLILLILLGFLLSTKNVPFYALLGSFCLTGILGWGLTEQAFKNRMEPKDIVQPMAAGKIFSISLPMLMSSSMAFVIGQAGVIMLGMFRSEAEVGYYAIAVRLASFTTFILQSINSIAAPKFSELFYSGNIEELFYVAKKSTKLIFWTTMPIFIGFVIFGKSLLRILFGHEFAVAYIALVLLLLGKFVNSISGSTGLFMNMTGNQNVFRNILFIVALSNIGLNALLIPRLGINGAALTAMASLIFLNISTLVYMKAKFGKTTSCL